MMKIKVLKVSYSLLFVLMSALGCSKDKPADGTGGDNSDPYTTFFKDEIKPSLSLNCSSGAYYRKVVSSVDYWLGISGKVVLPQMVFDPSRANSAKPGQYLDNPSVYMGGNMNGQETDIGLTWEVIKDENGNVTADRRAFRPFLRRSAIAGGQAATYQNAPAQNQYYWYPGEEVTMSVQIIADKKLRFIVDGAGKHYEADFDCDGYLLNSRGQFKRVNAIDQVSNEGKAVQPTKTRVENAVWKGTSLFRSYEGKVVSVPVHSKRFTDMRCPLTNYFSITASEEDRKIGAEAININGAGY